MKSYLLPALFLISILSESCKPDDSLSGDCFIPSVGVNVNINMNLPEYFNLQNLGEFKEINGGNRGIYLIHNYDDIFYAIERTCTYQSENDCSRILLDNEILQLKCGTMSDTAFIECCPSTFSFNSARLGGPALCNLKTYRVSRSGNSLYISN
mgnify:CR=1 FL=1